MNTLFLLMAQYGGQVIIPLKVVCNDYFSHLTEQNFRRKVALGDIDLAVVPVEDSKQSARGVHVRDLAAYLDKQHRSAKEDHERLHGRKMA